MRKLASKKSKTSPAKGWHVVDLVHAYKPDFPPGTVIMGPCFVVDRANVVWLADPVAGLLTRAKTTP